MKMKKILLTISLLLAIGININSFACTNYLITKGASVDGSTMISYAADSHVLFGELYHWAAATYPEGAMMDIYEWDTGDYLGQIEQARETYNVIGNMNEYQVAVGETTYGGRSELHKQPGAIMDYGSLMFIALQRSKTAREAIKIIAELMEKYGYYSSGESLSISDKDEVWIMEMISKGESEKGAIWVARRVPDGYVCAHANQARITTFPLENKTTSISSDNMNMIFDKDIECVYAADVISFARKKEWFKGKSQYFSFSDTYAPVTFGGARFCEIRVWTMFNAVADGMDQYWDYCKGHIKHDKKYVDGRKNINQYATNRMPLWIKPNKKVSVHDMMMFMRDHLEGTELDMRKDIGAGPFEVPYRWRPLTWKVDGVDYCNERATSTQQTGFSFVTQSRSWIPDEIGGIFWMGVDDAASTVYVPFYSSITKVPHTFARGNGKMMEWSDDAAFWVFNQVSNLAYTRYNTIHPEIEKVQLELENEFIEFTTAVDAAAFELHKKDAKLAVEYLTNYSVNQGNRVVYTWKKLYQHLFMRFMDGNIKEPNPGKQNPKLQQPGYGEDWYRKIIQETGDRFKVIGSAH